mmetsp:Transcript_2995/g.7640  ORF Transcript_2995/g.7640 Transcript_2995/m.7640 type:complete len:443 (-) Transcript_2995:168-1496(-)
MDAWASTNSTWPHTCGSDWIELDSPQVTPLPPFLTGDQSADPKKVDERSLGLHAPTCDIAVYADSDITTSSFEGHVALARHFTPMCLGLDCHASQLSPEDVFCTGSDTEHEMPPNEKQPPPFVGDVLIEELIPCYLECLGALRDFAALRAASSWLSTCVTQNVNSSARSWYLPLRVRCRAEEGAIVEDHAACKWPVAGKSGARVATLFGPKLWGSGLAPCVHAMLEAEVFRPTCGYAFGIVPEGQFLRDPQGSRHAAFLVDHFGRLHVSGYPVCLYGMHVAEGDRLSLNVRPVGGHVQAWFALNSSPLQCTSFEVPRNEGYSVVVFFDVCGTGTTPTQLRSPPAICGPSTALERAMNLVLRGLDPLGLSLSPAAVEHLTVQELKSMVAHHYATRHWRQVAPVHVQVWVGSSVVEDSSAPLVQLVQSRSQGRLHLDDVFVHVV